MTRPLIQLSVVELETLFIEAAGDAAKLKTIKKELEQRHVPKARALLAKVCKELGVPTSVAPALAEPGLNPGAHTPDKTRFDALDSLKGFRDLSNPLSPLRASTKLKLTPQDTQGMDDLFDGAPILAKAPAPAPEKPKMKLRLVQDEVPALAAQLKPRPVPDMPLDEAYKRLGATPSHDWEFIENRRRSLVLKCQPEPTKMCDPEVLAQAQKDASQFNDAALRISASRCWGG